MNIVIESKKSELDSLCSQFSVQKLEVFGSSVTEQFSEESSDLDFLVEFQELNPKEHADAYFGLLLALQNLFKRKIDLVETQAINNPYFLEGINETRTLLYAA